MLHKQENHFYAILLAGGSTAQLLWSNEEEVISRKRKLKFYLVTWYRTGGSIGGMSDYGYYQCYQYWNISSIISAMPLLSVTDDILRHILWGFIQYSQNKEGPMIEFWDTASDSSYFDIKEVYFYRSLYPRLYLWANTCLSIAVFQVLFGLSAILPYKFINSTLLKFKLFSLLILIQFTRGGLHPVIFKSNLMCVEKDWATFQNLTRELH